MIIPMRRTLYPDRTGRRIANLFCRAYTTLIERAANPSRSTGGILAIITMICLAGCTALDTTSDTSPKVDQKKPHVGRYYMLPKALVTIEGAPDTDGNLLIDASMTLVADWRHRYFLRWKSNPFYDDIVSNLDVDSDGMLTSVNYSAEDKTPQILSDLVATTINVAKIAKDLGVGLAVKPHAPFRYTFDPFDGAETGKVKHDLLTRQNIELQISPRPHGARSDLAREIDSNVRNHARAEDPREGGVFYHPPTTVEMLLIDHNLDVATQKAQAVAAADSTQPASKPATLCHVVITVPDIDQVACLRLGRSFLTKRESNLGFAHGMPTTFVFKQPSGVQAFTGLLSSISSTVATAVPTLVNVKSTSTSTQKAASSAPSSVAPVPGKGVSGTPGGAPSREIVSTPSGPTADEKQNIIDLLSKTHKADVEKEKTLVEMLTAGGKTKEEINQILKDKGLPLIP